MEPVLDEWKVLENFWIFWWFQGVGGFGYGLSLVFMILI
jgi:hypothetical protein